MDFEAAADPRCFGGDQLFFAAADDAALVDEVHRVHDLVLQERTDFAHVPNAAAPHQQSACREAGEGAIVAHMARQAHGVAVVPEP